jgi:hypothetical protein
VDTSDFFVRVYLTHWAGTEFVYPNDFIPTNHPGQPLPSPLTPGTYLIGEVQHAALGPNAVDIVNVVWLQAAISPKDVLVGMTSVHWHPCLLIEISPQDGPLATGMHVWDNNNLAQKNVSIVYADADGMFRSALVVGNLMSRSEVIELLIDRTLVPQEVRLYVDVLDPRVKRTLTTLIRESGHDNAPCPPTEVVLLEEARVRVTSAGGGRCCPSETVVTLPALSHLTVDGAAGRKRCLGLSIGWAEGREVFYLDSRDIVRVPLTTGAGVLVPIAIGGVVLKGVGAGEYLVGVTQVAADGSTSGAAALQLRVK